MASGGSTFVHTNNDPKERRGRVPGHPINKIFCNFELANSDGAQSNASLKQDVASLKTQVRCLRRLVKILILAVTLLSVLVMVAGYWIFSRQLECCGNKNLVALNRFGNSSKTAILDLQMMHKAMHIGHGENFHADDKVPRQVKGDYAVGGIFLKQEEKEENPFVQDKLSRKGSPADSIKIRSYRAETLSPSGKVHSRAKRSNYLGDFKRYKRCCEYYAGSAQNSKSELVTDIYDGTFTNFFTPHELNDEPHLGCWPAVRRHRHDTFKTVGFWPKQPAVGTDKHLWILDAGTPLGCFKKVSNETSCSTFNSSTGVFKVKENGLYLVNVRLLLYDRNHVHWAALSVDGDNELACNIGGNEYLSLKRYSHYRICRMTGVLKLTAGNEISVNTMSDKMSISLRSYKRKRPVLTITYLGDI